MYAATQPCTTAVVRHSRHMTLLAFAAPSPPYSELVTFFPYCAVAVRRAIHLTGVWLSHLTAHFHSSNTLIRTST